MGVIEIFLNTIYELLVWYFTASVQFNMSDGDALR